MSHSSPRSQLLKRWHRRIGFAAAILMIVLAISGIILNHREELALDQHAVTTPWVLAWYNRNYDGNCDRVESDPHPTSPFQGEEESGAELPPLAKGRAGEGIKDAQLYQARVNLISNCSSGQTEEAGGRTRWVSMERIVLDVHSGRILGSFGPWLMDGAAVLLLLLVASGITGGLRGKKDDTDER